nr:hypothetical protein [Tanacetum cinerariifolium]
MQWKNPSWIKTKRRNISSCSACTCTHSCYPAFIITADVPEVYMHQFWNSVYKHHDFYRFKIDKKKRFKLTLEVFRDMFQICPRIEDQDFDALPFEEDIVSFLKELGYTEKASPSKKDSVPVPADEEPVQKGKRVKRSAKKSLSTQTTCIVIREPHMETQSKRKRKGRCFSWKGIDLLSKVALTEEAHIKEVRKKSLRDFYKSHPSGFGLAAEKPPSVEKITPPVISEGTGDKPRVPDVTKDDSTESESESLGNDDDDNNDKEGNSESDQQDEVKVKDDNEDDENYDDKSEGDEDRGMDSDEVQDKKADVRMMDAQQEIENLEITQEQVVEDAHVTIMKKTEVPVTIPRIHTSTLLAVLVSVIPEASPVYTNIPQSSQTFISLPLQVIALEKDVAELKNDTLHTQVTALVDDHLDTRIGETREEFMNFLSASLTGRITEQVRNQLPHILPEEVSNFTSLMINMRYGGFHTRKINVVLDQPKQPWFNQMVSDLDDPLTFSDLMATQGDHYLFDQSKPLPLQGPLSHRIVVVDYFFNNDLKYLKTSDPKPSSTKETPKGKALSKGSKTSKSASAKEPVEEPISEVIMDDVGDDVARDDNQPQDTSKPNTKKTSNPKWFKQPLRPHDLEWNKRQILKVVVDEVIKRDNVTTSRVRLLPKRFRAPLDSCITLSSAH